VPAPSRWRRHVAGSALLLCAGCGGETATVPRDPLPPYVPVPSMAAEAYRTEVLDVMQAHSLRRRTIDWVAFRAHVFAATGGAQTVAQTFPAIRAALERLGDGHSSYRPLTGSVLFVPTRTCVASGALAPDSLAGWIVDLRGNGGGNMWPMLAGLGPVLGTGVLGWFLDPDGGASAWEYRNGAAWSGGVMVQPVDDPYTLRRPNPKVAVLVDNGVASSGEATFIAFRGRAATRSFGVATCGVSTANQGFRLSDGALLNLTVAVMADRARTPYGEQVVPDEIVDGTTAVVHRAVAWLRSASP
jgi:hypothetical protein